MCAETQLEGKEAKTTTGECEGRAGWEESRYRKRTGGRVSDKDSMPFFFLGHQDHRKVTSPPRPQARVKGANRHAAVGTQKERDNRRGGRR